MNAFRLALPVRPLLVSLLVATFARVSSAAGPIVVHDPSVPTAPLRSTFACSFEPGPLDPTISYAAGDGWNWIAWHIPQQPCGNCSAPGWVEARQVSFSTRAFANCNITAEVSIVAVKGSVCPMPDTTQVLYGPYSYPVVINVGVGDIHSIPLPEGWCLTRDAFVLIRFVGIDGCLTSKGPLALDRANTSCVNCDEWVTAINWSATPVDICTVFSSPIWIQLDTECCGVTPTLRHSWGSVKTLYR
jgi:hypothetical protein